MQALLIGAAVLGVLGGLLIYLNQRLAEGKGRAEAERDTAQGNRRRRRERDKILAEPVADEPSWVADRRNRLRLYQESLRARTRQSNRGKPRSSE